MIKVSDSNFDSSEAEEVCDSIRSGWVTAGSKVEGFERKFARFCGARFGVAVCNGTAALHLALAARGIGAGDEVILPTLTFISSANAVAYCGAKPVLVDSEKSTYNMDPSKIEKAVTKKTRAIMPVHLYGHPCDMDPINEIAEKHGLFVLEDAAEAHGAEYNGRKAGSLGHAGCFSFYGNKIITTGEGGMVTTDDRVLYERMQLMKNQGKTPGNPFVHMVIGFNYRMTDMQAALGRAQMGKIESFIEKKRQVAGMYDRRLEGLDWIERPVEKPYAKSVYWMYAPLAGRHRDALSEHLKSCGIETRNFFTCVHKQPCYPGYASQKFPVSEKLSSSGINLPSSTRMGKEEVEKVCDSLESFRVDA
jgi:perosamine synthetase